MHKESFVLVAVPWSVSRFPDNLGMAKTFVQKVAIYKFNSFLFVLDKLLKHTCCNIAPLNSDRNPRGKAMACLPYVSFSGAMSCETSEGGKTLDLQVCDRPTSKSGLRNTLPKFNMAPWKLEITIGNQ